MNLNRNCIFFFYVNQESYCPLNMSYRVTWNIDSNYVQMWGRKNGRLMIRSQIWLGNIFLYRVINHVKIKFLGKNKLVACYSQAVIAWKLCWKVTFNHRFDNNFWTVRNFWTSPKCFRKYTFRAWIWTEIVFFFFFWWKSRELLSLELVPPSFTKFKFQLCADEGY